MILCCGEALIDMIPSPTVGGGDGYVPHCGGAVFNTAIALGRLGVPAGLLSGVSTDLFGQQLRAALRKSHVEASHLVESERPTTLAFVTLSEGQASYAFYDENSAGRMVRCGDLPALNAGVSTLYFGGISLACEPAAETYAALCHQNCGGKVIMLDPNIRPGFITNEERFRARLDGMLRCADIVKVSDEDLNWIYPDNQPIAQKVAHLQNEGPKLVVLTKGGQGATAWNMEGIMVDVPVRNVEVVDTVGAGDTFNAGVLAYLAEHSLLTKPALSAIGPAAMTAALSFGASVAGVTVSRAGADSPWRDEVK